jgi:methionyl-tRNA formyltransferase
VSGPRVVFMGTPPFAVPALRSVARACEVALVVTQPDRPKGRGRAPAASAVACEAERLGLAVEKPLDLRTPEVRERLAALAPDLFAVVAFGAILSPALLAVPRQGAVNLHGSLLPEYRGASPVQRALWDGRASTGVTTLYMDEGIDTGDLIVQRWLPIEPGDDAGSLAEKLAELGGPLLAESLLLAADGRAPRRPQPDEDASYAKKLKKVDGLVDWALDAIAVWNHARAVTPWPGATTALEGRRLLVTAAWPHHRLAVPEAPGTVLAVTREGVMVACGPGVLRVDRVKPEGRSEMAAADWARGARIAPGARLGAGKENVT